MTDLLDLTRRLRLEDSASVLDTISETDVDVVGDGKTRSEVELGSRLVEEV